MLTRNPRGTLQPADVGPAAAAGDEDGVHFHRGDMRVGGTDVGVLLLGF